VAYPAHLLASMFVQGGGPPTVPRLDFAPSSLAQWLSAVGTILAVTVALFKDSLLSLWRKPSLDATCTKEIPWTVKTPMTVWQGERAGGGVWRGDGYFVRVKVENQGRTRAEKVQVSAEKLAVLGADDKFEDLPTILPLNLKWSNIAVPILDGLSPRMTAFCDVIALSDPANPYWRRPAATPPNVTVGHLQLEVEPFTDSHLLPPGTYRLTLRIAAANVVPIVKTLEFKHTGWASDDRQMRRECLAISLR
jgi:hypothetical protein